jgi:hypothetical protein
VQLALITTVLVLALCGCTLERDPNKQYTVMGQEIGTRTFREIAAYDSKVSFVGADPVKRREAQNLRDRYRERITLNNNGVVEYSKLFRGGFSAKFTDADMIEAMVAQAAYKDRGIIFDRSKVRGAGPLVYLVQSSLTHTCFVAYFVIGTATDESRQDARGNQEVSSSICYPAASKTSVYLEREMVDILSRARYDDGAGNRMHYAPAAIGASAGSPPAQMPDQPPTRSETYCYDPKLNVVSTPSPPLGCVVGDQQITEEVFDSWRRIHNPIPPNAPAPTLASGATPVNAVSGPPASAKEPSARLKQLEDAYRQNLLTPAEYQAKRKAILDSM